MNDIYENKSKDVHILTYGLGKCAASLGNKEIKDSIFVKYHQLEIVSWTLQMNQSKLMTLPQPRTFHRNGRKRRCGHRSMVKEVPV